jgi:hypothetical protein
MCQACMDLMQGITDTLYCVVVYCTYSSNLLSNVL